MAEVVILDDRDAKVTTTRVILDETTYPVNGITSVRMQAIPPGRVAPIVLCLLGLIVWMCTGLLTAPPDPIDVTWGFIGGGVVLAIGIVLLITRKTIYSVVIGTAGGDRQALLTPEERFAVRVREAVDHAVTDRG